MAGDHVRHRNADLPRLAAAFVVVAAFMAVELVTGFLSGSLALLSDAAHMGVDALGLGMALAAIVAARAAGRHGASTYGWYRLEIIAALANAALVLGVGVYVLYEAVVRLGNPPEVATGTVLLVATIGLAINFAAWLLLRPRGEPSTLNLEGARLEVLADAFASVGVIAAAVVMRLTGWLYVDALVGAAIALFILPRATRLAGRALRILVEAAPERLDVADIFADLAAVPGVVDVHDVHVWTLASHMDVASAHLVVTDAADGHQVLDEARRLLREDHGLDHATLQVEPTAHEECAEPAW